MKRLFISENQPHKIFHLFYSQTFLRKIAQSAKFCLSIISALILFNLFAATASAAVFTVINLNDSGAGSLRQAIADANTLPGDDTINFNSNLSGSVILTGGELIVNSNILINGHGANLLTVERSSAAGTTNFRIFNIAAQTNVTINNITIKNGKTISPVLQGAGILNAGTLQLTSVIVTGNRGGPNSDELPSPAASYLGGGIYNTGQLTISGSTISNNGVGAGGPSGISGYGAGIANSNSGTMTLTNTVITANNGFGAGGLTNPGFVTGGAIYNSGTAHLDKCSISENNISGRTVAGGGIGNTGTLTITNTTLNNNDASGSTQNGSGSGGGINNTGTLNVSNSTLFGNTVSGSPQISNGGGGIYSAGDTIFTSITVAGNASNSLAGGGLSGTFRIKNSIVADNTGSPGSPNVFGTITSDGHNLISNTIGSSGWTAGDLINVPAHLGTAGNYGGTTLTIPLLPKSPAINTGDNTNAAATDQRGSPRIINGTIDIGAFESNFTNFDFDGDGKTDISIFRPSLGEWWINRSSNATGYALQFGSSSDKIAPADFTGDGKTDVAFSRPSTGEWFVLRSEDFSYYSFPFGTGGDVPAPADFDADGKADAAVFRPSTSTWYVMKSTGGTIIQQFGQSGDVPVVSDFDADGKSDIAIYRFSLGEWWINRSTAGLIAFQFGNSTDKPVQGDYTGDGKSDVAFFRPATGEWFVLRSENQSYYSFPFGTNGDIPTPGDYDGDGKADAAVFRASDAHWYLQRSTAGFMAVQFGFATDKPVPSAFIPSN